jgi:N-methylhydantoinase A
MLSGAMFSQARVRDTVERLRARAAAELGAPVASTEVRYELRYAGQSFEVTVQREAAAPDACDPDVLRDAFAAEHERRYGYRDERGEVELVNVRVSALGEPPLVSLVGRSQDAGDSRDANGSQDAGDSQDASGADASAAGRGHERERTRLALAGEWIEAELWRGEPPPGARIAGPALCAMPESTLLVPPDWGGAVDAAGTIVLQQTQRGPS